MGRVARRLRADRGRAVGSQAPSSPSRGTRSVRLTQPSNGRVIMHRIVPSDSRFSTTRHFVPADAPACRVAATRSRRANPVRKFAHVYTHASLRRIDAGRLWNSVGYI